MKAGHIAVLFKKDIFQGSKNFFFTMAIIIPLAMSLFVSLAFGNSFSGKASLGIYGEAGSAFIEALREEGGVRLSIIDSEEDLLQAVGDGDVDMGLILPKDFDEAVRNGERVNIPAYVWGESLANDRITVILYITGALRTLAGHTDPPIEIVQIPLGDNRSMPWSDRLLPMIVLMAVAMTGLALSGSSLLEEKIDRTFEALNVTQVTVGEIFFTKALLGVLFGLFMGLIILFINRAFGIHPWLLIILLVMGSLMMTCIGVLIGSKVKDTTSFFAAMKGLGFFLYLPGVLFLFPRIPRWISMIFPTYYLIHPITEISLKGKGFPDIALDCIVMFVIDLLLILAVAIRARRLEREAI